MAREPIVRGGSVPPAKPTSGVPGAPASGERVGEKIEDKLHEQLRPQRLQDVIGQRDVCARLEIALDAARKRGEPLGHILFDGPPGLGKTTFATVLPRELDVPVQLANAASMTAVRDILPYLTNAAPKSVLFIDEIHRLPKTVEEFLYPVMEDFRIDIVLGEGMSARTINLTLKPFTLIGATTRSGMLSAPLRNRFQLREHLDFYEIAELAEIVRRNSEKLKLPITPDATLEIARRSRGTPRLANNHLRWVRDYATSKADGKITGELAHAALDMYKIDLLGLDGQDRKYLETLIRVFGGGPTGVEAIAHTMSASADTLEDEVEPFLLRIGFVIRTPRGRMVTPEGFNHLGIRPAGPPPRKGSRSDKRLF